MNLIILAITIAFIAPALATRAAGSSIVDSITAGVAGVGIGVLLYTAAVLAAAFGHVTAL
jgi:hypothetical protein